MELYHQDIGECNSHEIIYRTLQVKKDGTPDYTLHQLQFASTYVADKVYDVVNNKMEAELAMFLRSAEVTYYLDALTQVLFERKAHDLLKMGRPLTVCNIYILHDGA